MKHFAQMSIEKMPVVTKNGISSVVKIIPFVGCIKLAKQPFVHNRTPFVSSSGFTLVELMVTLAVVAILVVFAVPNMRATLQNNRIITQNNNLLADISLARSEAIRRVRTVTICTWNSTTAPACNGGGNWSSGRLIWADQNRDGIMGADEIVRSREGIAPMTLNQLGGNVDPIIFNGRGQAANFANTITFLLCDDRGPLKGKDLRLTVVGQVALFPDPPASCI